MENGGTAMMAPAYASTEKGVRRGQEAVVKVSTQEQNEKQCGLFEGPAHWSHIPSFDIGPGRLNRA